MRSSAFRRVIGGYSVTSVRRSAKIGTDYPERMSGDRPGEQVVTISEEISTPLAAKVALVTGAGRNIGRAIALALAEDGADVVVNVRTSRHEAEQVADEIRALGRRALVYCADVQDSVAVDAMFATAREQLGPITIVVNNAAIRREAPFLDLGFEEWQQILSIILDGAFICSQAALREMTQAGWGRIVNIAGVTAQSGAANRAHVVTAKAGLIGLTKALALEFAAHQITVNAVSPGMIETVRGGSGSLHAPSHHGERSVPVQRRGTPDEVASLVRYLVSDAAAFVTGQTLNINGGVYV